MDKLLKVFLGLLLAGLMVAAGAADKAPIRIGVSLGLSGRYAEFARMMKSGYQLWEAQVNERGGIMGHPVQIIIRDDKSDLSTAVEIYKQFIDVEKVDFVFGPYSSQLTGAVAALTEKNEYPMLAPGASSDELWDKGYRYLFGVFYPGSRYLIGFFDLLSNAGIKNIAVVGVDDPLPVTIAEGAKRWAPQYGLNIVEYRVLPKKNPDFESAAKSAREKGAQVLVLAGFYEESVHMRQVLKQIQWTPTAFYASVGPTLAKYREALGPDAQGTFTTTNWEANEGLRLPGSADFLRKFRARFNEVPSQHAAAAYVAAQVLEQSIIKAGTIKRTEVRDVLASIDTYNTIMGRYSVDRSGLPQKRIPLILQWQQGGREVVWPLDVSTAKPMLSK